MTDPHRLVDQDADDFERSLLRSARIDVGPDDTRARCVAALAGVTLLGAKVATAASGVGLAVKWIGIGAVVGLAAAGTVKVGGRALSRSEAPPRACATAPAIERPPEAPPTFASVTAPEPSPAPEPRAPPSVDRTAPPSASFAHADDALDREVGLLDTARSALARGDTASALRALDRRDREFPRGALGPEALVIRVQVQLALGNRAGAQAAARGLLVRNPDSAQARTLRTMLDLPSP
jgi:hypothetical protein